MLSIKYPAVLVFSVLPMHNIRKQKANFQVRSFQELSQWNMFSPPLLVWSSDLLWYKERWGLASLTSSVGGSTHDGSYPGNLAVGDAVNSLKLFKVDCESFRKGVCKPNRDGGPEHHCPAPSSVGGDVAQVWGEWRRHGQSRPQSKNHFPVPCREKHIHVLWNVHIIQPGIILFNSTITQKYRETLTLQAFIFCWLLQVLLCKSNTVKITLPSSTTLPSSSTCILNTCPQKTPTPSVLRDRPHFSEANACTLPSQQLGVSPQGWLLEVDPCSDAQPVPRREGDATLMPFSG